jgi:hypothetical protein
MPPRIRDILDQLCRDTGFEVATRAGVGWVGFTNPALHPTAFA